MNAREFYELVKKLRMYQKQALYESKARKGALIIAKQIDEEIKRVEEILSKKENGLFD